MSGGGAARAHTPTPPPHPPRRPRGFPPAQHRACIGLDFASSSMELASVLSAGWVSVTPAAGTMRRNLTTAEALLGMRSSMELKERPSAKGFGDFGDARRKRFKGHQQRAFRRHSRAEVELVHDVKRGSPGATHDLCGHTSEARHDGARGSFNGARAGLRGRPCPRHHGACAVRLASRRLARCLLECGQLRLPPTSRSSHQPGDGSTWTTPREPL